MPDGARTFDVAFFFEPGDLGAGRAGCAAGDAMVLRVFDPDGALYRQIGMNGGTFDAGNARCGVGFEAQGVPLRSGVWTAEFSGSGVGFGRVVVTG